MLVDFIPVVGHAGQGRLQPRGLEACRAFAQPVLPAAVFPGLGDERQTVMGDDQPADGGGQRCLGGEVAEGMALDVFIHAVAQITSRRRPIRFAGFIRACQSRQPAIVIIAADEGQKQAQRNPFVAIAVAFVELALQPLLEGHAGLAQVVQKRSQLRQQADVLRGVPVVLVAGAQDIAHRGVGWHRALAVETFGIADDPQQLAVVHAADPVARHGRVFECGLAQ